MSKADADQVDGQPIDTEACNGMEVQEGTAGSGGEEDAITSAMEPPFAKLTAPFVFWQDLLLLIALGGVVGCFGYGYLKAMDEVTNLWLTADGNSAFPDDPETLQFGAGKPWWIAMGAGTGLVVGLTKMLLRLDAAPSFIDELKSMHVNPRVGSKVSLCTLLGLLGGAPIGPEAGLAGAAGVLGTLAGTRLRTFKIQAAMRQRLLVLASMAAGFGSFLPNPLTAVLLVMELANPVVSLGMTYMHAVVALGAACTAGFAAYYGIAGAPYMSPMTVALTSSYLKFDEMQLVEGMLFGVLGAALGLVFIVMLGIAKATAKALKARLDSWVGQWPRVVIMCCLAGTLYGLLGYAMPLVLTDGAKLLVPVMVQGKDIGSGVLAASSFAKALAYSVCIEFGFTGGIVLPLLQMGLMLGRVFVNITSVNQVVALSCSLISLAAALVPAPAFLAVLAVSVLVLGPSGLVPLFTTAGTAHTLCMGIGIPQALAAAAAKRKRRAAS